MKNIRNRIHLQNQQKPVVDKHQTVKDTGMQYAVREDIVKWQSEVESWFENVPRLFGYPELNGNALHAIFG